MRGGVILELAGNTGEQLVGVQCLFDLVYGVCYLFVSHAITVYYRMESSLGLTRGQHLGRLWRTRTVKRFTTLHPTSTAAEQEQLQTARQSQVSASLLISIDDVASPKHA